MASVKFYLKEPKSEEETLIVMYFMAYDQQFKISTQQKILPAQWDSEEQQPRRSYNGYADLRTFLQSFSSDVLKIYTRLRSLNEKFSLKDIKNEINKLHSRKPVEKEVTLFSFIDEFIERSGTMKTPTTVKSYRNTKNHLIDFVKRTKSGPITFSDIDLAFYDKFTSFLIKEKGHCNNTVGNQIKILKTFLNEATEQGLNSNFEFRKKRFKKLEEDGESIYLTQQEINTIYELDLSTIPKYKRVRDLFIIGCYTGLRFSDFSQLRKENIQNNMISMRTQKTDHPTMIPVHKIVRAIFDEYIVDGEVVLPKAISNQKMNEYLKEIGRMAGLTQPVIMTTNRGFKREQVTHKKYELISCHTSRRSFATNLYLMGFPSISIMKITGHKTEKAFLKYIKISPEENAMKLMEFWGREK